MSEPSKQDQQQEPSMEEILASIRRIISDDGSEGKDAPQAEPERSTPPASQAASQPTAEPSARPVPASRPIELSAARAAPGEPPVEEHEDPLELTDTVEDEEPLELNEAVRDDGTVVDLAAQRAAARAEAPPARPEPVAEPEPAPAPEPYDSPELELYGEDDDHSAEAAPEDDMAENEGIDRDRLVSEATEAATLAALSELARTETAPQHAPLPGGERTLEQVVREAISEHLRTWLDANLPTLVERVVRDEVRRLARRAEDT